MATGYILLFPGGTAPDGTGSINNTAALTYEVSTGTQTSGTPKASQLKLLFDGTTDEHWMFSFLNPGDYASGGTLRGKCKFTSATSGTAILKGGQGSSTDSNTDDDAVVFAAKDVSGTLTAPGTQGQVIEFTITLTTTNMGADKKIQMFVGRDPTNGSDTITTDLELTDVTYEYTTT